MNNPHVRLGQLIMSIGILVFIAGLAVDSHLIGEAIALLFVGAAWQTYVPVVEKAARKVGELVWRSPFSVVMASGVTSWVAIIGCVADGWGWAWWFAASFGLVTVGMTLEQIKNPPKARLRDVSPGRPAPWVSQQPELIDEWHRLGGLFEVHGFEDMAADMREYAEYFAFLEALTSPERLAAPEPVVIDPTPAIEASAQPEPQREWTEAEIVDAVFDRERLAEALAKMKIETTVDESCACGVCSGWVPLKGDVALHTMHDQHGRPEDFHG